MNSFVFLLAFFTFSYAVAGTPKTRMVCATAPLSTSYTLLELEDAFELQVKHHNGTDYMPIYNGLITKKDLETLGAWLEIFVRLGDAHTIFFDKSQCQQSEFGWKCVKPTPSRIGNLEVQNFSFEISAKKVTWKDSERINYDVSFAFLFKNAGYNLPMIYENRNCVFRN